MTWLGIGIGLAVVGQFLAAVGAWLLYRNAAPDLGHSGIGVVSDELRMVLGTRDKDKEEAHAIEERHHQNQRGFILIMVGALLQLAGTVAAALG